LFFLLLFFAHDTFLNLSFFFQFHPSTLDWLGIKFHDFFFYRVTSTLWPGSQA
jgi:hypothetical protein